MTVTLADIIDNVADHYGVPRVLARACAWQESAIIANRIQIGVPLSEAGLGLYQLTPGGELGNLTESQAFNPATNCEIALATFAAFKAANPSLTGGLWAATAQRPAAPEQYAADVNGIIAMINAGTMPTEYATNCNTPAGVDLPYAVPTPPTEDDVIVLTTDPINGGTIVLDLAQGTYDGIANPDVLAFYKSCGVKTVAAPTTAVFAHFSQLGTV